MIENLVKYLLEKANFLSESYENQIVNNEELADYLTVDIANEWLLAEIKLLRVFFKRNLINKKILDLYSNIYNNFTETSFDGKLYDDEIWTLNGLKNHKFWEKQRELAKELSEELNKIKSD